MSDIEATILQYYDALRERNWDRLAAFYADDIQYRDPDVSLARREDVLLRAQTLEAPFSDVTLTVGSMQCDDHGAAVEWVYEGKNNGRLLTPAGTDFPPSGKTVILTGMSVFRFRGGKIVAERSYWDNLALYHQLGLVTDPQLLGAWT